MEHPIPARAFWFLTLLAVACHEDPSEKDCANLDDTALPLVSYTAADCVYEIDGAECGWVTLPEKHDGTATNTLSTAILPATGGSPSAPLVLFTGGPGGNVFELASVFGPGAPFESLNVDHDIVLIAERGAFGAEPFLGCPDLAHVECSVLPASQGERRHRARCLAFLP